jgi:hypothetical protein
MGTVVAYGSLMNWFEEASSDTASYPPSRASASARDCSVSHAAVLQALPR